MRALVTGANGFLGQHLVTRLLQEGYLVRALVRSSSQPKALEASGVELMYGDVGEPSSLLPAVEGCQLVFHLAGVRRAPSRELFFRVNAQGTRHLCEAMARSGSRQRLILCSSLAASGPSTADRPRVEEDPPAPVEWYGESKLEAERIAFSFGSRMEVTAARPCRILGPGDRENLLFFRLAQKGIRLVIEGGPRPISTVDVEDAAAFLVQLSTASQAVGQVIFVAAEAITLEGLQELVAQALQSPARTIHLSPWMIRSLAALADGLSRISGRHLPLNRKLARQLLAPAWTCSIAKAQKLLGYAPQWGIADSVRRSAAWYQQQGWL
jgi:nucleoside-diphosphate-sugar epimerase